MIRILALILRNQWVPEGSDRKDHRGEEEVGVALWEKAADIQGSWGSLHFLCGCI